jgi:hypothetical protein
MQPFTVAHGPAKQQELPSSESLYVVINGLGWAEMRRNALDPDEHL